MLYYQIILLICSSFLLPKSILSPKCISPVPQSLSPEVNLCLYPHSAETETHIYFSSRIAETFDLLGFSRQKADCFHMRRKLFLILNSEIIAFCEKIYAPFMGVSFYPGNSIIKIIVLPTSLHKHISLIPLYSYHTNSGIYYS